MSAELTAGRRGVLSITAVSAVAGLAAPILPTALGSMFAVGSMSGAWVPAAAVLALVAATLLVVADLRDLGLLFSGLLIGLVVGSTVFMSSADDVAIQQWKILGLGAALGLGYWLAMMFVLKVWLRARHSAKELALPNAWIFWMLSFAIGVFAYQAYLFPEDWQKTEIFILLLLGLLGLVLAWLVAERPTTRTRWVPIAPVLAIAGYSAWIVLVT